MTLKEFEVLSNGTPDLNLRRDAVKAQEKATRAWDVQAVNNAARHTRRRAADDAQALSRAGLYEAVAGVCNAALSSLVGLCYEVDGEHFTVNVDPATWRVLVPVPWSRYGHKHYGLRSTEAETLRAIMLGRQDNRKRGHLRLLWYEAEARRWFVNFGDYTTKDAALGYLHAWPVGVLEVRNVWTRRNAGRVTTE